MQDADVPVLCLHCGHFGQEIMKPNLLHRTRPPALVAILVLSSFLTSCSQPKSAPSEDDLQPLLGKTVREVATALRVPESALRAGDEPPGRFRFVSGYFPTEPHGRKLTVYVSREASVMSPDRKVTAVELLDKTATGIAISFPVEDKRSDVVVGNVIPYYHMQP